MEKILRGLLCVAAALLLASCAAPKLAVRPTPTANPETSYKLITPPDAPHYTLQPGQSVALPKPKIGYFAPPVYPPSLAHPGMPPVQIKAQLVFATSGQVQNVYILSDSYAGAGHALFENAVRDAAKGWVFTPLVFESYSAPAMDAGTLQREARPFSLWFEFSFRMVNGKPSTVVTRKQQ